MFKQGSHVWERKKKSQTSYGVKKLKAQLPNFNLFLQLEWSLLLFFWLQLAWGKKQNPAANQHWNESNVMTRRWRLFMLTLDNFYTRWNSETNLEVSRFSDDIF